MTPELLTKLTETIHKANSLQQELKNIEWVQNGIQSNNGCVLQTRLHGNYYVLDLNEDKEEVISLITKIRSRLQQEYNNLGNEYE